MLLWEGSITGVDAALQLVLIIDYILDWARDIYRPSIIRQLMCIAGKGAYSVCTITQDPDILSMIDPKGVRGWLRAPVPDSTVRGTDSVVNQPHPSIKIGTATPIRRKKHLYSQFGLAKDGRRLECRVRGLFITADNLNTLLQGFQGARGKSELKSRIEAILKHKERCFMIPKVQVLSTMEEIWSGEVAHLAAHSSVSCSIMVFVQTTFWVGLRFELIRQLTYLAIAEEAFNMLDGLSDPRTHAPWNNGAAVSAEDFLSAIRKETDDSKEFYFERCLERYVGHLYTASAKNSRSRGAVEPHFQKDARFKRSPGLVHDLVKWCYSKFCIGDRKPTEAAIRHLESTESVVKPDHKLWSKYPMGILAVNNYGHFCLYAIDVKDHYFSPKWLVRSLASRLAVDGVLFRIREASANGTAYRVRRGREWSKNCSLGNILDGMYIIARWILSTRLSREQLERQCGAILDAEMLDKLKEFREEGLAGMYDENFNWGNCTAG